MNIMDSLKNLINLDLKISGPPEPEPVIQTVINEVDTETGEVNPNFVYNYHNLNRSLLHRKIYFQMNHLPRRKDQSRKLLL